MRSRLHFIITKAKKEDRMSKLYDIFICLVAFFSLTPMMFREHIAIVSIIDTVTVYILFLDYILRWITCDMDRFQKGKLLPFLTFPFRPLSLMALLGILPSLGIFGRSWKFLRILRLTILMHYSSQIDLITSVLHRQREKLMVVLGITASYIYAVALIVFNYEPETFNTFYEAIMWASTTITSVSFRSEMPQTVTMQIISLLSTLVGIGIIALPTGIITSGFMEAINEKMEGDSEETAGLNRPLNKRLAIYYLVGMVLCSIINVAGYRIAAAFELPLWLDTLGTILAAVLMEPTMGLLVGFVNNLVMALTAGNFSIVYYSISAMTAIVTGLLLKKGQDIRYKRFPTVMLLVSLLAGTMSYLITLILTALGPSFTEISQNVWEVRLRIQFVSSGMHLQLAAWLSVLLVKVADMAAVFGLAYLICRLVDLRKRFKRSEK